MLFVTKQKKSACYGPGVMLGLLCVSVGVTAKGWSV
ncbi:hypothetical protein J2Z52_001236 [Enterococcus rivorum]|nr:hypothetical protein [Enterococcus rivorum]